MLPCHYMCRASPVSASRIPKPRTTVARSTARSLVEESLGSGSTGTEESTGRSQKRARGGPKKPVEELEKGWVGSGIELPTDNVELPAALAGAYSANPTAIDFHTSPHIPFETTKTHIFCAAQGRLWH